MGMKADTHVRSGVDDLKVEDPAARILDSLGQAVLVADCRGSICYKNATAAEWLPDGTDLGAVLKPLEMFEPFDGWPIELRRIVETAEARVFQCGFRRSGATKPSSATLSCTPLRVGEADLATGVVLSLRDGASHDGLDKRIEISRRLTSLGKLATRVAHELNNPLDGTLRYVNLASRIAESVPNSKLSSYLAESRTGLMRMIQIIGDLLEFSRTTDGAFEEMDINEIVEQSVKACAQSADASGVIIACDFQTQGMPFARGSRIYQVCCNLIKNAIDAMPNGGRLSITTGLVADEVILRFADTGAGLPDPVQKVFEPFFSTKPPGQGTGLGLAICRDFIDYMKGTIAVAHAEGGGAIFTIRIPVGSFHRPSRLTTPRQAGSTIAP